MDLTLGELADKLSSSPRDLSEAINGEGGLSFYDYINRYRLQAAKILLLDEPGEQILSIAHRSGFNSKSTFNKIFKNATGVTPTGFRPQQAGN